MKLDLRPPRSQLRGILAAALALVAMAVASTLVLAAPSAQPLLPHAFYGSLTIAGSPAPAGTEVCGLIGGVPKGCISTTQSGQYGGAGGGVAKLIVQSEAADIGKAITFTAQPPGRVAGTAQQTATYTPCDVEQLNLTLATQPALPPPATPVTPAPTPAAAPTPVVTPAPTPAPVVLSEAKKTVAADQVTEVETPDGQVLVQVPADALPPEVAGRAVELEVKSLDPMSVPPPPPGSTFIRAIEINNIVDGQAEAVSYTQPVVVTVPLTQEDLDLAEGDPTQLSIVRFNPQTAEWDDVPTTFVAGPPLQLQASLTSFSTFAVTVRQPEPTPTTTPAPTATPAPTSAATPAPPATPAVAPTPTPTLAPAAAEPTPTVAPTPIPTLAPAVAPSPPPTPEITPPPTPEQAGGTPLWLIAVIVFAVLALLVGAGLVVDKRRRQSL